MGNESCKFTPIVGNSDFTKNISLLIKNVSENSASVLLVGERGTGKRLIAQHIHYYFTLDDQLQNNPSESDLTRNKKLNKKDFFEVNCKSFSSSDIQMIFDGILRFIPAGKKVTLFMNYVDELSLELQNNLLNLIKKTKETGIVLKVICSSEKNLEELIASEKEAEYTSAFTSTGFSSDLFYHINTVVLNTLPLRLRKDDILSISDYYREMFRKQSGFNFVEFSEEAKIALLNQFWKGNIDELINSIQRAFIVGKEPVIKSADLGLMTENLTNVQDDVSTYVNASASDRTMKTAIDNFKRDYLTKILEENNWNQTKSAKILGIQRTYVIKLINELDIRK